MEVIFDNRQIDYDIEDILLNEITRCVSLCLNVEGIESDNIEVSVSFVNNDEIRKVNRDFRNIDKETDVLSFPMEFEFSELGMPNILGDIVISVEKAIEQAKDFGHSVDREILYLVCHSMFHLMGYDHMTDEDKKIMREKEKITMKKMEVFKNEKK